MTYEHRQFEINCRTYDLECDDGTWWWICGNETDNEVYESFADCLQAAMDHASRIEAENSEELARGQSGRAA